MRHVLRGGSMTTPNQSNPLEMQDGAARQGWTTRSGSVAAYVSITVAVFLTAFIGIELTKGSGRIASIWLANAVVLLALLRTPAKSWTAWVLCGLVGNVFANVLTGDSSWMAAF